MSASSANAYAYARWAQTFTRVGIEQNVSIAAIPVPVSDDLTGFPISGDEIARWNEGSFVDHTFASPWLGSTYYGHDLNVKVVGHFDTSTGALTWTPKAPHVHTGFEAGAL